jgi:hypothetical protein
MKRDIPIVSYSEHFNFVQVQILGAGKCHPDPSGLLAVEVYYQRGANVAAHKQRSVMPVDVPPRRALGRKKHLDKPISFRAGITAVVEDDPL